VLPQCVIETYNIGMYGHFYLEKAQDNLQFTIISCEFEYLYHVTV